MTSWQIRAMPGTSFFLNVKVRDQSEHNWSCGTMYGGKNSSCPKLVKNMAKTIYNVDLD